MKNQVNQIDLAIDSLRTERERMVASMANWDVAKASKRCAPDLWSPAEMLEHLCKSEQAMLSVLWELVEAAKTGSPAATVDHPNRGRTIEEIVQPYKASKHKTIPLLEPDLGGPCTFWLENLKVNQALFDKVPALLDVVDPSTIIFPHFVVGTMDAYQWLTFMAFHMDRHRHQIEILFSVDEAG